MSLTHVSLTRFLIEEWRAGRVRPDLRLLLEVVVRAGKSISVAVGKGVLGGVLGDAGTGNVHGAGHNAQRLAPASARIPG